MKVKINNKGKEETYNVINSWEDVTMERWIDLVNSPAIGTAEEAEATILALSDIPKNLIKGLSLRDVSILMEQMGKLQRDKKTLLKKVMYIDGKEYGFHANLSDMTLGEFADLETFIKAGVENNLPEIMSVLFRPIVDRDSEDIYTIEAYDGNIDERAEVMKKMSAEQVQSALVFFWNFVQEYLNLTQLFLLQPAVAKMKEEAAQNLTKSGDGSVSSIDSAIKI